MNTNNDEEDEHQKFVMNKNFEYGDEHESAGSFIHTHTHTHSAVGYELQNLTSS